MYSYMLLYIVLRPPGCLGSCTAESTIDVFEFALQVGHTVVQDGKF